MLRVEKQFELEQAKQFNKSTSSEALSSADETKLPIKSLTRP